MGIVYNARVQKHSTGIKELGQYGDMTTGSSLIQGFKKQVVTENSISVQRDIDNKISNEEKKKTREAIVRKGMMDSIIYENINKLNNDGKEELFKQMIFESFYNGLVLDDEFKAQNVASLKSYSDKYINDNGGYRMLKEASMLDSKNIVLRNMVDVCEKTSRCVANKKVKEAKESSDVDSIIFNLSEEDKEEIRYNADLGIDQVSSIVKDKVKNVLMNEKDRQAEEEELLSELELAEESSMFHKNIIEETTLFNALMRNVYKEYLTEKASCKKVTESDDTTEEGSCKKTTEAGCKKTTEAGCKKTAEEACKKTTEAGCKKTTEEATTTIDMDVILAEAICQYTMMEVMNTLCIESFTVSKIKKMSHDLLYK